VNIPTEKQVDRAKAQPARNQLSDGWNDELQHPTLIRDLAGFLGAEPLI
jgi:hypothetical protein